MTRETKIGLAIATTFLSLVGLVVASKMRRPDASAEPMVELRPDRAKPATEEPSEAPPLQPRDPLGVVPAKQQDNEPPQQQPRKSPNNGPPTIPALPEPLKVQPASVPPSVGGLPQPATKPAGGLPGIEPNPLVVTPVAPNEPKKFGAMPPVADPLVDPAPLKVAGVANPGIIGLPQLPPITVKDPFPKDPFPQDPLPKGPFPKDPFAKDPLPKDPFPKDPLPAKLNGLPELPAANGPFGSPIQLPPVQSIDASKQKPEPKPIITPLPDPVLPKLDVKVGNPVLPEKKGADPMPPPLTTGGPVAPAPKGESIGTIGNTGGEIRITSPVTPGSPGLNPGGGVPLLPTGNNSLPKVTNHEDKPHVIQAGDTSFDELSKTLYGTPVYGRALLEYNRQHVLATANLKQDPPILQPNQRIYYPDKNILEIQYNQLIHGAAAPAVVAPAVKISAPTPLVGPGSVSGTNPPTADATVAYRLAQPQFIFDVARQQLGDGLLWPEILRLNPALHTDQPIPAGTELRLPKAR